MTRDQAQKATPTELTVEAHRLLGRRIEHGEFNEWEGGPETLCNWRHVFADGSEWSRTFFDSEVVTEEVIERLNIDNYASNDVALEIFEGVLWPRRWRLTAEHSDGGLCYQIRDAENFPIVTEKSLPLAITRGFVLSQATK